MKYITFFLTAFLFPVLLYAQAPDNPELKKMYEMDQAGRRASPIDWVSLNKSDRLREIRVYELIDSNKVNTGMDYYHSAMIFQHGKDSVAYGMAVKLMRKAIDLDSSVNKWLLAAAIDRELMSRKKPQIYGTQYVKINKDAKWELYTIDTTKVTDQERKYYRVETLAEQKVKAREMNLLSIAAYHKSSSSINKTSDLIKEEKKKEANSSYNVSESAVNTFAYQLMAENQVQDALTIFKLNTKLYPQGYNTFDSLGECLLKLNRKKEAIKAYKKSLDLNSKK